MSYLGASANDRLKYNLSKAEDLLNEPTNFTLSGNPSAAYNPLGRLGTAPGGRDSNYTRSEFGDQSDTASQIQARLKWGAAGSQSPTLGNNPLGSQMGSTEIGVMELDNGSRRGRRLAGGANQALGSNASQGSYSLYQGSQLTRPQTGGPPVGLGLGAQRISGTFGGAGDILDAEINRAENPGRSGNLLSDAGSKFGEDDMLSQYIGHSEYGGISDLGEQRRPALSSYQPPVHSAVDQPPRPQTGSRRAAVAARQGISLGSGSKADSRPERLPPRREEKKTANFGVFLSGPSGLAAGGTSSDMGRSKSEGRDVLGSHGQTINSNTSENHGIFLRGDKSQPPPRRGVTDFKDDTSVGGKSQNTADISSPSPLKKDGAQVQAVNLADLKMGVNIIDNKAEYLQNKKKEELVSLQTELQTKRARRIANEESHRQQILDLQAKHRAEIDSTDAKLKKTIDMLGEDKDRVMSSIPEAVEKEHHRMEQLHKADLDAKEKIHGDNILTIKSALQKETGNLESQLAQQTELRKTLEHIQKRTNDLSEIVQSSLRQREDELRRREVEMARLERELIEDEQIQVELEERKLAQEERKLQSRKDVLLKQKQFQNEEINRLREQRQQALQNHATEEQNLRLDEKNARESLSHFKRQLEQENDRRRTRQDTQSHLISDKEIEINNAKALAQAEKEQMETDMRMAYILEIQGKNKEIEDRKKALAQADNQLRQNQRLLERKQELITSDKITLKERIRVFNQEKVDFETMAQKIQDTSDHLNTEREAVLKEKAVFDIEKEKLDYFKHQIDVERSLLHSEFARAEELEHELSHREKMLKMLKYQKENRQVNSNLVEGPIPNYTSCPRQQQYQPASAPNAPHMTSQAISEESENCEVGRQGSPLIAKVSKRFDYDNYMSGLQKKMGDFNVFNHQQADNSFSFTKAIHREVNQFAKEMNFKQDSPNRSKDISGDVLSPSYATGARKLDESYLSGQSAGFRAKIRGQLGKLNDESKIQEESPSREFVSLEDNRREYQLDYDSEI